MQAQSSTQNSFWLFGEAIAGALCDRKVSTGREKSLFAAKRSAELRRSRQKLR
ncbi:MULTISPECIES: hypothetical protein [Spirulina sp. CCY15215]|uniref:hypothetical protein n=1 Tax=Spirulina sp. CCY15215 TaxID=2767591 RepID=UPI00194F8338|nr:hypothetical protein [Spirulina major]